MDGNAGDGGFRLFHSQNTERPGRLAFQGFFFGKFRLLGRSPNRSVLLRFGQIASEECVAFQGLWSPVQAGGQGEREEMQTSSSSVKGGSLPRVRP